LNSRSYLTHPYVANSIYFKWLIKKYNPNQVSVAKIPVACALKLRWGLKRCKIKDAVQGK